MTRLPPALRGRLRQERGQTLVEFAIVLPVLLLVILGILYFGRYEEYSNQETQLAEEGARWAAVDVNPSSTGQTLIEYIEAQASGELKNGSTDVTTPLAAYIYNPTGQSNTVRVCVAATVKFPTPAFTITATIAQWASMRIEQTATVWSSSTTGMPTQCPTS